MSDADTPHDEDEAAPTFPAVPETQVRAAQDKHTRDRLIALKAERGRGERPAHRPHGRWLGDFLDQPTETGLLPGEEKLLTAVARGEVCWLGFQRPDSDEARADRDRHIRGPFARFLALGGDDDAPVHARGIRLGGAVVSGEFDLQTASDVCSLTFAACRFDTAPVLRQARIALLNLQGSFVPGLEADGANITGNVFLHTGFIAEGEVRLPGATIGGQLSCIRGTFRNRTDDGSGIALACDGANITGTVFLSTGFIAEGEVCLNGATIGGQFVCTGGTFSNAGAPNGDQIAADALNLSSAKIAGGLWLGPAAAPNDQHVTLNGSVDLQGAHAGRFTDHAQSWPAKTVQAPDHRTLTCVLALDGFTYDRFAGVAPTDAATRKRWLARQSHRHRIDEFRPQPYEQLAKVLREMGHSSDARKIAKARQAQERWARAVRHRFKRPHIAAYALFSMATFGLLTGYGYGVRRLIAILLILFGVGWHVYDRAGAQGLMAPTNPVVFANGDLARTCAKNWTECARLPKEHTAFSPVMYSLDALLPIVALGVEKDWAPIFARPGENPDLPQGSAVTVGGQTLGGFWGLPEITLPTVDWPHLALRLVYWLQVIGGWVFSGLLLAVLSGVMKTEE